MLDLGIIMDCSGSVGHSNFKRMKEAVKGVFDMLEISKQSARVGIIRYNKNPSLMFDFKSTANLNNFSLKKAMDKIYYLGGYTRTDRALRLANSMLFSGLLIVVTELGHAIHIPKRIRNGKGLLKGSTFYKDVFLSVEM